MNQYFNTSEVNVMNSDKYKKISKNQSMKAIAFKILEISERPMHYKELSRIMLNVVGYYSNGESPCASLNSKIGQDKRFLKKNGIVELRKWKHSANDAPKTLEKSPCHGSGTEMLKDFKTTPNAKNLQIISKMEESVGRGIINEDVPCDYFETYTEPLDRTK